MKKLATTELAVLGMLAWSELSGYDLLRAIDNSVRFFWSPAKSRVYSVLPRLLDAGLVLRRDVEGDAGPDKSLYRASAAGKRAVRDWILADTEPELVRSPFLLKLFFGNVAPARRLRELIEENARGQQELLAYLQRAERNVADDDPYALLTIRYGIHRARATRRWAKEALELVARLETRERAESRARIRASPS